MKHASFAYNQNRRKAVFLCSRNAKQKLCCVRNWNARVCEHTFVLEIRACKCVHRNDGERVWKEKSIRFSVIRNVNISRVTKGSMRTNLTVCSATVRFMHLERTAAEILRSPQAEERTAQNVPYRTDRRIMKRLSKDMQKLQRW